MKPNMKIFDIFSPKGNIRLYLICAAAAATFTACNHDISFDACGQIDAVQVTVSAENSGRILALDVEEGQVLGRNERVGAIDSIQTWLQIRELNQRMEGAQARIIDIDKQMAPQRSQLESLGNDLKRFSALLESNAGTRKQVEDISSQIAVLKGQMDAQKQTWERNNEATKAEIATYKVQAAQREDMLSKCRIVSPVAGRVLTKYAEEGECVTSGKPLFKIADMDHVFVRAYFTSEQLGSLKIGDILTVIPDDGTPSPKEYEGVLTWISDQAEFTPKNIQTRNERADLVYAVKVGVKNDGRLRLGMYAYVRK
ncbi:MAG: HlyD family secretion protein [Candidatus Cryptobacteroides sp.]